MPPWVNDLSGVLALLGLGGGGAGFWAWLKSRPEGRAAVAGGEAAIQTAQAAYQTALASTAETYAAATKQLIDIHQAEIARQRETIHALDGRVVQLEAENEQCRGENAQLRADIALLRRQLVEAGVACVTADPPPAAWAQTTVAPGVEVATPIPGRGVLRAPAGHSNRKPRRGK